MKDLMQEIETFRDERDWRQFHKPRNLAAALAVEVSELQELFLWTADGDDARRLAEPQIADAAKHEVADVLIYALLFCSAAGIDPTVAIRTKLSINAQKYPVDKARGRPDKYTAYAEGASNGHPEE
jgi:dCTP diphosphatase